MIYSRRCQYSHSLWLPENAKPVISYNKNLFVKSTILSQFMYYDRSSRLLFHTW